jgi:hypothetical protein
LSIKKIIFYFDIKIWIIQELSIQIQQMSSHEESSVFDVISQDDDRNESSIGVISENQNYGIPSQYRLSETRIT